MAAAPVASNEKAAEPSVIVEDSLPAERVSIPTVDASEIGLEPRTSIPPLALPSKETTQKHAALTTVPLGGSASSSTSALRAPTPPPVPTGAKGSLRVPTLAMGEAPRTPRLPAPRDRRGQSIPPAPWDASPSNPLAPVSNPLAPLAPLESDPLDALKPVRPSMLAPPPVALRTSIAPKAPSPSTTSSRNTVIVALCAVVLLPALVFAGVLAWRLGAQPTRTVVVANSSAPAQTPVAPVATAPATQETPAASRLGDRPPPSSANRGRRPPSSAQRGASTNAASPREDRVATNATPAPAAADPDAARAACARTCHGNVDCVIRCTVGNSRHAAPADDDDGDEDLPATPPRGEVQSAFQDATSEVLRCANGRSGTASVEVTFASSGRVTTALVSPPYAGTAEGSCMARALRLMRVPPFSQPTFRATHAFRVTGG